MTGEARTVTLAIWAVPKRADGWGQRRKFAAETEEGGSYVSAASQEASGRYCAWIELPYDLEQELKLSIRLEKDGERQVQLLETIGNLRVQTGLDLWCDWQGSFGYQRKDGSCAFGRLGAGTDFSRQRTVGRAGFSAAGNPAQRRGGLHRAGGASNRTFQGTRPID